MKKGNVALEINAGVIEGPRGLSIKELKYKETSSNGDNIYEVIREDGDIIGEVISKRGIQGEKGDTGNKGDDGRGIVFLLKRDKQGPVTTYEFTYTDGTTDRFMVEDGENAYEVAIDKGFEGTEEEWLLSLIGKGLEFSWEGTRLGVRVEGEIEYQYSDDLKGENGEKGDTGKAFYIVKTYSNIVEMQADFNNNTVKNGEYVVISSTDGDNGKLFEKKESGFQFIVQMGSSGGESKYLFVDETNNKLVVSNMDKDDFATLSSGSVLVGTNVNNGSGGNNVILGCDSGSKRLSGDYNIGIGYMALRNATGRGGSNIAIGNSVLNKVDNNFNIGIGGGALSNLIIGTSNVAIGINAASNVSGSGNVAIGFEALLGGASNSNNIAIGAGAGKWAQGIFNVAIGYNALQGVNLKNAIGIGYNTQVTADNQAQIGDSSVTVYCYGAVQNRSDKRDKTDIQDTSLGLNFLIKLKPREYRWDYREDYIDQKAKKRELEDIENLEITEKEKEKKREEIFTKYSLENVEKDGSKKGWRFHQGFIAQEVFEVMKELGVDFGGYQDHSINNGKDVLSLGYEEFIPILVKGLQEQQREIESLKSRIEKLEVK